VRRRCRAGRGGRTIGGAWQARAAGSDVATAGSGLVGADPERVELPALQMKTQPHGLAGHSGQVVLPIPLHRSARAVALERQAVLGREGLDHLAVGREHFHTQLAFRRCQIDEEMLAAEPERTLSGPSQLTADICPGIGTEPDPEQSKKLTIERMVLRS
jgi:hypothetical protein